MALDLDLTEIGKIAIPAIIAFIGGVFFELIRGRREKKNRFLEEKRLMYRNVVQALELLDEQIILYSKFQPYFKKIEELEPEVQEIAQEAHERLQKTLAETRSRYGDHLVDFSLLSSRETAFAFQGALGTLEQILICIDMDEPCEWSFMQVIGAASEPPLLCSARPWNGRLVF